MRCSFILLITLVGLLIAMPASAARRHHHAAAHHRSHAASLHRVSARRETIHRGRRVHVRHRRIETRRQIARATIPGIPLGSMRNLPPLRGSYASLVRQNQRNEAEGLLRIQDDADLIRLRNTQKLVALPVSAGLRADERLPANRRYCRPWTARFLSDLARVHYSRFHRPLQVNSAVRTVAFQEHLLRINGNAAPASGDIASPHLTGATIDIAKKGLSVSEIAWMRAYLLPLQAAGKLDVEEEFYQSCFHITVYKSYVPGVSPARHLNSGALLAASVR